MRFLLFLLLLGALHIFGCSGQVEERDALESARQAYAIGHFSEAERIYQHYLQSQPQGEQRWEAWNRLVEISINILGDYEKATGLLDSMYLEYGDDPQLARELLTRLAHVHESMQRHGEATKVWRKVLGLPGLGAEEKGEAYIRLSKILRFQRDFVQSEQVLDACVQEIDVPEIKASCLYEYAQTLEYMVRRAQAQTLDNEFSNLDIPAVQKRIMSVLNQIRTLEGINEERRAMATFLLADVHESRGDRNTARELFASIRQTYPNPMVIEARLKKLQ